jgi:hypothetical protein
MLVLLTRRRGARRPVRVAGDEVGLGSLERLNRTTASAPANRLLKELLGINEDEDDGDVSLVDALARRLWRTSIRSNATA